MNYFSVPADFKTSTLDEYKKLNNYYEDSQVYETYGNITIGNKFGSGRAVSELPDIDLLDLREYIKYSKQKGIKFNYTLNAPHMQNKEFTEEGIAEIKKFLTNLYEAGVRSLTIALPSLMELVKSLDYDFKLKTSTLCQITNPNKALMYKKRMDVDRIVVDESINRDFFTLEEIVDAYGDKVEVIVNPLCHKNCMYRMFHYNQIAGDSIQESNQISVNYYEHRCVLQRYKNISELLKLSWIRPEDIKYYENIGINYYKLQGRQTVLQGGDPVRAVRHYCEQDYDGNLIEILDMFGELNSFDVYLDNKELAEFINPFYENKNFCENNCLECNYCENFAEEHIEQEKNKETIELAKNFYKKYDEYNELIDKINPNSETKEAKETDDINDLDVEFDL